MRRSSRNSDRSARTTPRSTRAQGSGSRCRGSSSNCTAAESGSRARRARVPHSRSRCRSGRGRRADPHRRGQRQEPQARARRARSRGLPAARNGKWRGCRAARAGRATGAGADGHSPSRHRRHRGAASPARRRGHARDSRHRGHGVGDDPGPRDHHGRGVRRLSIQADQRAAVSRRRARRPRSRAARMTASRILVVDDTPSNVKLLADVLGARGYAVLTAASGGEALEAIERHAPDLVLLDVMMPGMSGYDVCRKIRANPATTMLPVIMVTALDPAQERVKGIEAGADDFLTKPIHHPEILARVRSLLRIKSLHDQLAELNRSLERRVEEQVMQLERLGRLKRFFSPALAEAIVTGGADDPLKSHRRDIVVVFLDLRGFTAFAETAEPEEVMGVLREYHAAMGELILEHEGTLERFTGDGMMIFFNDPVPVPNAAERAICMAVAMRERVQKLAAAWRKRGWDLALGVG